MNVINQAAGDRWALYHGDSAEVLLGLPDAFAAIRFQLEGAGWIIRGEPIETDVPTACRYANDNGLTTQRHFVIPANHEDDAA